MKRDRSIKKEKDEIINVKIENFPDENLGQVAYTVLDSESFLS
jgi:hypothetical protein